ncbi:hypothetical protein M885DRAFT_584262 [Pelagophyceae sp. CCMP2097]|nr:hypothetical protein M885DRAFT_584262 [Pelagophyceae sp. CCMP2097]
MPLYFKLLALAAAAARAGVGAFAGPRPRLAAPSALLRPRAAAPAGRRGFALGAVSAPFSARGAGAAFYARHVAPLRTKVAGTAVRLATFALMLCRFALRPSLASARAAAGALPADVLRLGPAAGQNSEAISAAQKWCNLGVCFVGLVGLYFYQTGANGREVKRIRAAQAKILEHERKYFTDDDDDDDKDKDKKDGKDGKDGDKPKAGGDGPKAKASNSPPKAPPRPERKNVPSPFKAGPPGAPKPKPRGR